jgi:outer membrane lipoprotein SlyB
MGTLMQRSIRLAAALLCAATLGACANYNTARPNAPVYSESRSAQPGGSAIAYGRVRSIEAIGIAKDQPQGAGAVLGGVVGAVVGRQMADSSRGENVGMVVGAVGGALIGNEIEKNARRDGNGVRVTVTLDNGSSRSFEFKDAANLRVGDRVRIEGTQLFRL